MDTEKVEQSLLAMYSNLEDLQVNESIRLYDGSLSLNDGSQTFQGQGYVEFAFVPEVAVRYKMILDGVIGPPFAPQIEN